MATKRAAATANGITGIAGYASTVLSGWGLGTLVHARGWNVGYGFLILSALIAMVLFAIAWNADPTPLHRGRKEHGAEGDEPAVA